MYRLMIVDDESIEREGLKVLFNKHFSDQIIIEEAENGKKALELAYSFKPDIVFMDVRMPGIEGLDVIDEMKKVDRDIKFVVVSAIDSFTYAQRAINADVYDYLLKPVKRKKVIECVENLIKIKDQEFSKRKSELALKLKLKEYQPFIENEIINTLSLPDYLEHELAYNLKLIDFECKSGYIMIIKLVLEELGTLNKQLEITVKKKQIHDHIRTILKKDYDAIVGLYGSNRIIAMISLPSSEEQYTNRLNTINLSQRIRKRIRENYNQSLCIGIGTTFNSVSEVGRSFKEAMTALTYDSGTRIIHYDDIKATRESASSYPLEKERILCEKIKMGLAEESKLYFDEIVEWIFTEKKDEVVAKTHLLEVWTMMKRALVNQDTMEQGDWISTNDKDLFSGNDLRYIRDRIWADAYESMKKRQFSKVEGIKEVIESAKEFIYTNYHKDITLEEVAFKMSISPYYFSRMFKQQTGENFIDFLTAYRIDKSKNLITSTNHSFKVIAQMVGYKDPNYFSRVFKKSTGVKPSEYKKVGGYCGNNKSKKS